MCLRLTKLDKCPTCTLFHGAPKRLAQKCALARSLHSVLGSCGSLLDRPSPARNLVVECARCRDARENGERREFVRMLWGSKDKDGEVVVMVEEGKVVEKRKVVEMREVEDGWEVVEL